MILFPFKSFTISIWFDSTIFELDHKILKLDNKKQLFLFKLDIFRVIIILITIKGLDQPIFKGNCPYTHTTLYESILNTKNSFLFWPPLKYFFSLPLGIILSLLLIFPSPSHGRTQCTSAGRGGVVKDFIQHYVLQLFILNWVENWLVELFQLYSF